MRKMTSLLMFAAIVIMGCERQSETTSGGAQQQWMTARGGQVEVQVPSGWYPNPEDNPFDLQLFSEDQRMNTGVFVFPMADLASHMTPAVLLGRQIEDIRSKRENVEETEPKRVVEQDGKTLTSFAFAAEKDDSRCIYHFTLIEFKDHPEVVAVALQIAFPSEYRRVKPTLDSIIHSARLREDADSSH